MKRRLILVGALTACLVAGGTLLWILQPRSAINKANFDRIEKGMSLATVRTLLGGPDRKEVTGTVLAHLTEKDKAEAKREGIDEDNWALIITRPETGPKFAVMEPGETTPGYYDDYRRH